MARQGLRDGDLVTVTSRRGSIVIAAQASAQQQPAQAFIAMHWGEEFLSGSAPDRARALQAAPGDTSHEGTAMFGVNALTTPVFCPRSKQPELKNAAIKIMKAELPWRLLAIAWMPERQVLAARESLKSLTRGFGFASCVPFGRERTGLLLRAAAGEPLPAEQMLAIEECLGLGESGVLHYADARRGQRRTMKLAGEGDSLRLDGFLLAGDVSAETWLRPLLQQELPAQAYGRMLLVPGANAPVPLALCGRQVCSCFNVSETEIRLTLSHCGGPADVQLDELQRALKCGTNCGSCLPELRRMVRANLAADAAPMLVKELS